MWGGRGWLGEAATVGAEEEAEGQEHEGVKGRIGRGDALLWEKGIGGETTRGSAARVFHSWGAAYIQQT